MADAPITVAGHPVSFASIQVPRIGPWFAELEFTDEAASVTGRVEIVAGDLRLSGTVVQGGTFGQRRKVQVVAGGGAWGNMVTQKGVHNDAGVKARDIADAAARAVGETLGTFTGGAERLGPDYARQAGPASRILEDVARGAPWWVDAEGVTHVGERAEFDAPAGAWSLLAYDPATQEATLTVDDLSQLAIGWRITDERLDAPIVIASYEIRFTPDALRVYAWCGRNAQQSRLLDSLRAIAERLQGGRIFGSYRYRVIQMSGDRVDLQIVRAAVGVPDLATISEWSAPGVHAQLAPGCEVMVAFEAGDPSRPFAHAYVGKGGTGHVPTRLEIGGTPALDAARKGDTVKVLLPPAVFSGTIGGVPATGVLAFLLGHTLGTIDTGSGTVGIGT